MRRLMVVFVAICVSAVAVGHAMPQQSAERFERGATLEYLLYVPSDYDATGEPVPLLLFLHGAGERGDDLEMLKAHGPPKLIESGHEFPAIIVSPQAPRRDWWARRTGDLLALLDDITERFNVDEDRVYVTGLSMGGYGTWSLLLADPERFAAAIPICGGGSAAMVVSNRGIREVPIWAFHGDADGVVPVQQSIDMIEALRDAGGVRFRLTTYPGIGHDSWTETYDDSAVWEWLWSQRRRR